MNSLTSMKRLVLVASFALLAPTLVLMTTATAQAQAPSDLAASVKKWKTGDQVIIQYAYSDLKPDSLLDAALRSQIADSITTEQAHRSAIVSDMHTKVEQLKRAAGRADSSNPLLRRYGAKAAFNRELLIGARAQNNRIIGQLQELAEIVMKAKKLSPEQLAKLSRYNFVEAISLANKSMIVQAARRLRSLNESGIAVVRAADPIPPAAWYGKGMQIVKSKKGVFALGLVASLAIQGYAVYSETQSEKAENDFHDALVFDKYKGE